MDCSRAGRALAALALLAAAIPVRAQETVNGDLAVVGPTGTEYRGASALGLALRRLGHTGRVLMIAAHPDDEDTQLLARLALGEGADVAYLSLTRGEGGQNAIGSQLQEALGIIRTEELLAARRVDGARQFFTRAYDFGFSKHADETFRHWVRDSVLSDVVHVIRRFRPDVVVSVWTGTERDGHGHHQAAGILAKEAFTAAADPTRFPAQLRAGLTPWRARKLYEGGYFRQDSLSTRYATGVLDPLLGRSYAEVAAISRGRHQSQEMGRSLPAGPRFTGVHLVAAVAGPVAGREGSIFQGVDSTIGGRAAAALAGDVPAARMLARYDSLAAAARASFNPLDPDAAVDLLARAARLLLAADSLLPRTSAGELLRWYVRAELEDARSALVGAQRVSYDATASVQQVVPGETLEVTRTVWNGGALPLRWRVSEDSVLVVAAGGLATRALRLSVPGGPAAITEPYYLRAARQGDMYAWPADDPVAGLPFQPPLAVPLAVELDGIPIGTRQEITYRAVSPTTGETRRPVRVVPALSVRLDRAVVVRALSADQPLTLAAIVGEERGSGATGELRLQLPPGWTATPASVPLRLAPGESRTVRFALQPPAALREGEYEIAAVLRDSAGREYRRGFQLIDFPHIDPYPLYAEARTRVRALDVVVPPALRARPIGYVMGPGDDVPAALAQLGLQVEQLTPAALSVDADFTRYAAIVVGVRAYEYRPELRAANRRLLEWVRGGGTLLVQYQQSGWADAGLAPYPMSLGRPADRVTEENAPVTVLEPEAPLLNRPNRITAADWQGWVQERGLYFPRTWDPGWKPLLELSDPGEAPTRGALLVASHGEGTVIFTGLSFFRQLPAGVPGAYRLFVNLLAGGR